MCFDLFHQRVGIVVFIHHSISNVHAEAWLLSLQMQVLFVCSAEVLNDIVCCFKF